MRSFMDEDILRNRQKHQISFRKGHEHGLKYL
jgi:hypothetical protein